MTKVSATVHLTGPYEGKTIVLNHRQFVEGKFRIVAPKQEVENLARYMAACYQARTEVDDGQRRVPQDAQPGAAAGVQPPVRSDGAEPPAVRDVHVGADDGGGDTAAADVPGGDGLPGAGGLEDPQLKRIRDIVFSLDPEDDTHWTGGGLPAVTAVEEKLGSGGVTRELIARAAPGANRKAPKGRR